MRPEHILCTGRLHALHRSGLLHGGTPVPHLRQGSRRPWGAPTLASWAPRTLLPASVSAGLLGATLPEETQLLHAQVEGSSCARGSPLQRHILWHRTPHPWHRSEGVP